MVYISCLCPRILREGVVTKEGRSVQVWDLNEKAGAGMKRLGSKELEKRRLERDATFQERQSGIDT
jgi:hypothetical protein